MSGCVTLTLTLRPQSGALHLGARPSALRFDFAPVLRGEPGPVGDAAGALLVANRLSELATTPETQAAAQRNLGLGLADPLAYYILAKS